MTAAPATPRDLSDLSVGQEIARTTHEITRDTLVRYAGASGDFNPIHYNDTVATDAGLPGVIAHGMLTMGVAVTGLLDALGDPTTVRAYSVRFTNPVPGAGHRIGDPRGRRGGRSHRRRCRDRTGGHRGRGRRHQGPRPCPRHDRAADRDR